jgi:hypothetical protein
MSLTAQMQARRTQSGRQMTSCRHVDMRKAAFAQTSQAFAFAGRRTSRCRAAMKPEQEKAARVDRLEDGRNAPAQFVYDIVEMTDCILEAINSSGQAFTSGLTGRLFPSISRRLGHGSHAGAASRLSARATMAVRCYFLDNRSGAVIIITSLASN